jgi:DNA-directed RNA polymerase subunit RPC12/RpoP
MSDPFDIHEHRHELKQLRDSGDTKLFENRDEVACPACGSRFRRLFSTRQPTTSFPENDGSRFCLVRGEEYVHVFRH